MMTDYEAVRARMNAKPRMSQEEIDAQNLETEQTRENILKMITRIKCYALDGSKLAQETVEYWDAQWADKIQKRMVFKGLERDMMTTIEIIKRELGEELSEVDEEINEDK